YAENLRHVLHAIEGHLLTGYADGGDIPDRQLKLLPGAVKDASDFLKDYPDTRARFDRVANLVEGFESPFGMELLSTVHWVIHKDSVHSVDEAVRRVHAWNNRKMQFSPRQVGLVVDVLSDKGWADNMPVTV
ncbi:MAG: Appr-1-p processing protein, partial [Candidatus Electrothrix sp. ATG2]|nr:Appr-1-p processing protein [Candidatus Electrothrix sp. ATG2]